MSRPERRPPALSPILILGFAMRPLPLAPLRAGAALAMEAMLRRHRSVFERLIDLPNPVYLVEPIDLPFRFLLDTALPKPGLRVLGEEEEPAKEPAATIRGSLPVLVDLLEGRIDGDALFFSRDLSVEGDMAAVVALRNAVDGADIALMDDLLRPLGPLGAPARTIIDAGGALYRRAERDLETLRAALLSPVQRRFDAQDARFEELDRNIATGRRGRRA
jgi:predicted lipid carrier protein YhbT